MDLPALGDILLEKYRVEESLGEGGFGAVFRATTLASGRPVAIKVLKPGKAGYQIGQVARFTREMRAIANLGDPHTLTLFDFGRLDSGLLAMVTEYIEGHDLAEILAHRTLGEGEAIHIMLQVLYSLREAHEAGLLHRDIKPGNIRLFEHHGDSLRVKVLDFGLAMSHDSPEARLTGTGRVIGTPRYMSPEHLSGQTLTPATDIYSLGVMALEMLIGRKALIDIDVAQGPAGRRLEPSSGFAPALCAIVNRMLAVDPAMRYADAGEVIAELRPLRRAVAAHKRGEAEPTWGGEEGWEPPPASTVLAEVEQAKAPARISADAALYIGLAVLLLGIVGVFVLLWPDPEPRPVRVRPSPVVLAPKEPEAPKPAVAQAPPDDACARGDLPFRGFGELRGEGLTATRHYAYIPSSSDGSRKMPLVLFLVSKERREHEEKRGKYGFPVIRALAERLQAVALFPVADSRPSTNVEKALAMVDSAAESVCTDHKRIVWIAANANAELVHDVACLLPGVVVTVGGPVVQSKCASPHLHVFPRGDQAWPVNGWPACSFDKSSKRFGCDDATGTRRRSIPRDAMLANKKGCLSTETSVPSHAELSQDSLDMYQCRGTPEAVLAGNCLFRRCDDGTLGFCTSEGGRPWTPAQRVKVAGPEEQHRHHCAGQPDPRAGIDKMVTEFARYHWATAEAEDGIP